MHRLTREPSIGQSALLIVLGLDFEECLRMVADRAFLRSLLAYVDVSAVRALPDDIAFA